MSDYVWDFVDYVYNNRLTPTEGAAACSSGATVGGAAAGSGVGAGAGCIVTVISDAITKLIMGENYYESSGVSIPIGIKPYISPIEEPEFEPTYGPPTSPIGVPEFDPTYGPPTSPDFDSSSPGDPAFDFTFGPTTGMGSDAFPTVACNDGF